MATTSDSTTPADTSAAAAPAQATQRTVRAKATLDKHESILFKIKLQDATGKHVPVYEVANKTIGFFCSTKNEAKGEEESLVMLIGEIVYGCLDLVLFTLWFWSLFAAIGAGRFAVCQELSAVRSFLERVVKSKKVTREQVQLDWESLTDPSSSCLLL